MPHSRMESKVESVEKNSALIDEQLHNKLSSIEELLTTIARSKTIIDNSGPSSPFVPPSSLSQTSLPNTSTIILNPSNKHSAKQVELPVFCGTDALGWLAGANQYFEIHQTRPDVKVPLALVCMEGRALHGLGMPSQPNDQLGTTFC